MILRQIINPGDLVFDIGANVGNATKLFKELGAKVIAVEPNLEISSSVTADILANKACTDTDGNIIRLYLPNSDSMGTLSTLATTVITNTQNIFWSPVFTDQRYLDAETVSINSLIKQYGLPRYIKIDIEGGEEIALKGLSQPVDYLSFEVHSWDIESGVRNCQKMLSLGNYKFTACWRDDWSPSTKWGDSESIIGFIKKRSQPNDWWNIFCRLTNNK